MQKAESQRQEWLGKMTDYVLENGLDGASLRPLAKAAGTSDRMLVYYFKDKAGLMTAILQQVAARTMALMVEKGSTEPLPFDACLERTISILSDPVFEPHLRLFLQIASQSAQGEAFYRQIGEQLGRVYFEWAKAQLVCSDEASHQQEAAILIQRIEGMVFLNAIGLHDINDIAFGKTA